MTRVNTPYGVLNFPNEMTQEQWQPHAMRFIQEHEQAKRDAVNPAAEAAKAKQYGVAETVANQALQGATANFADEIMSGIGGGIAKASDWFRPDNEKLFKDKGFGDLYNEAQQTTGAQVAAQQEQRPVLSTVSQLAGSIAPIAAAGATTYGKAALDSLGKGGLLARAGKNAAFGTALGGAYGAGGAEDGKRLESAKTGALLGGAVGGAAPVVAAGVKGVYGAVTNPSGTLAKLFKIDPTAAKDFAEAGVESSVGALSNSPTAKVATSILSKAPGASGRIRDSVGRTLDDLQVLVSKQATAATDMETAGAVLQSGVKNYKNRFATASERVFKGLDKYVQPGEKFPVQNSAKLLNDIAAEAAGAKNLQAMKMSDEGVSLLRSMADDAANNGGTLPYTAIKQYRSRIGELLSSPELRGKEAAKRVYGALSADMESAFGNKGEQALAAYQKANKFYQSGAQRMDNFLQPIFGQKTPEKAFKAALSGTKEGATQLGQIMKSLKGDERRVVSDTVLERLGKATPGAQNAEGDVFSVATYLTNWNKLSDSAKKVLFGDGGRRASLDRIARIAERVKDVERIGGNPSGTASHMLSGGIGAGLWFSPLATGGALLGSNGAARLMTNQKFLGWLAKASIQSSPAAIDSSIRKLPAIAKAHPELAPAIARYAAILGEQINMEK